jgi:hypothetical protein
MGLFSVCSAESGGAISCRTEAVVFGLASSHLPFPTLSPFLTRHVLSIDPLLDNAPLTCRLLVVVKFCSVSGA